MAVIELTTQNFNEEVLQSDVPVMVDFWASSAGAAGFLGRLVRSMPHGFSNCG